MNENNTITKVNSGISIIVMEVTIIDSVYNYNECLTKNAWILKKIQIINYKALALKLALYSNVSTPFLMNV